MKVSFRVFKSDRKLLFEHVSHKASNVDSQSGKSMKIDAKIYKYVLCHLV